MKFENTIKRISTFVASFVLFFLCAGIYLELKGFTMTPDGKIVLVNQAQAQETSDDQDVASADEISKKVDSKINIILPKGHILGQENAPISIYEYSSFGCFHCADFHLDNLPKLKKDFIDTGKVKMVFANFPLDKKSMQAAMVSECIPQENYHEFLNTVFKNQREWGLSVRSDKILSEYAALNGISKEKALECMKDDKIAKEIVEGRQEAIEKLKIQGTPAFLIISDEGKEVIHGAPSYASLKKLLEKRLKN